jgi:hypothetical protein
MQLPAAQGADGIRQAPDRGAEARDEVLRGGQGQCDQDQGDGSQGGASKGREASGDTAVMRMVGPLHLAPKAVP